MNNAKSMILHAQEVNEMPLCFLGEGKYNISNRIDPAPFNENMLLLGIDEIYKENNAICYDFFDVINELCDLGSEEFFIAFRYMVYYLDLRKRGEISFELRIDDFVQLFSKTLTRYKNELMKKTSIDRIQYKKNPYQRIIELNDICIKEYGIRLISNTKDEQFLIYRNLKKHILEGIKVPHNVSEPVIYKEENKYYLACFVFFYNKEDIERGMVDRPTIWVIADIETGKIIEERQTCENDFSDALYDVKYNIKSNVGYDTSKKYYDDAFAILDFVRNKLIETDQIYRLEYKAYLKKILANIPEEYQRFYTDLSI